HDLTAASRYASDPGKLSGRPAIQSYELSTTQAGSQSVSTLGVEKRVKVIMVTVLAALCTAWFPPGPSIGPEQSAAPRESRIPVGTASLYVREIGQGPAVIVLHGGPDFDHSYLVPELDRLSDKFHLIYYDQRGRGRSADGVKPEDVTLESDIADVD